MSRFDGMIVKEILERDPQHWTSAEAVLILSTALAFFAKNIESRPKDLAQGLLMTAGTICVYAAPRIDTEILLPWETARDVLKLGLK